MSSRKEFLAAAASLPLIAAAPPSPQPTAAATATPAARKRQISEAAKALAAQMRTFDPSLTDKELDEIADGIDGNLRVGARLNPHGTTLKNWDEPVTVFEVPA